MPKVVCAYQTTWITSSGLTPYELVFSKVVLFPIEFEIKTMRTIMELAMNYFATQKERIAQFNQLDECRQQTLQHLETTKKQSVC